jgi:ABC-type transport system involved in multi-copper enzyme maturation permease subunit
VNRIIHPVVHPVVVAETLRRHFTSLFYLSYLAFVAIIALGVSRFNRPGSGWPTLVALLAIVVGSVPIGPEFSSGTLQLILVKPVKRWVYLLSRVTGVVLVVWVAALLGGGCELLGRLLWTDAPSVGAIAGAIVNCFADSILTASLLVFLGSLTRAYFNVAIYLATQFGLVALMTVLAFMRATGSSVGQMLQHSPAIERGIALVHSSLFPEFPPQFDTHWLAMVLIEAAVALVLACLAFRTREVPYGAD